MSRELHDLANKLIDDAENMFGNSIGDWKFSGIEINDRAPCLIYYPTGEVTISLSKKVIKNNLQLIFQLSHEVCHLLHPSLEYASLYQNKTLVINEGISTFFSIVKTQEYYSDGIFLIDNLKNFATNYYDAYCSVTALLKVDDKAVKKLRAIKPRIDKLVSEDFSKAQLELNERMIMNLIQVFVECELKPEIRRVSITEKCTTILYLLLGRGPT
jgi:hypothetical protein